MNPDPKDPTLATQTDPSTPTGNAPATPVDTPKPEDTVEYWKQQYNGKNGTAVKLQRQLADTLLEKEQLAAKLSEVEVVSTAKIQTYEEQLKAASKAADEARAEAGKYAKASLVRAALGKDEYKVLSELYSDEEDILSLAAKYPEEAELSAFLTKQAGKLSKFTKHTAEERNLGSTPTPPPATSRSSSAVSTQDTSAALEKATLKGFNSPEYKEAFAAHIAAVVASSTPLT